MQKSDRISLAPLVSYPIIGVTVCSTKKRGVDFVLVKEGDVIPVCPAMIVILRTAVIYRYYDSRGHGRSTPELSSSALSGTLSACPRLDSPPPISPCLCLPPSPPLALSRSVFFSKVARASTRATPRKASSRAIPVITTTSIFVKSLSPLSSSPSFPFSAPPPSPPSNCPGPSICRFINPVVASNENRRQPSVAVAVVARTRYFPNYKFLRVPQRAARSPFDFARLSLLSRRRFFFLPFRPPSFPPPPARCRQSDWICPISRVEREKGRGRGHARSAMTRAFLPLPPS